MNPYISLIKIHKSFELIELDEGIYQSSKDPKFHYIRIPDKLEWGDFDDLIRQAKQNEKFTQCDFAIAVFRSQNGYDDYIRVFSDQCSLENQRAFQNYIHESIKSLTLK